MNKTNIIKGISAKFIDKINEKPILRLTLIGLGILWMIMIPRLGASSFFIRVLTMIGLYTILALSLNLITGYTGQVSIGQAGFCAIGAYTSALLNVNFGLNYFITSLCGALMAGLFGFLLGLPTLRLSGPYLTIATLGFGEIVRMIALNFDKLTNGPLGISGIQRPLIFGFQLTALNGGFYYLVWALVILITLFLYAIVRSKMGRALMAIRDDELVATLMGIKTTRYKVAAFSISAVIAGIGGSFYAHMIRYIDPNTFNFDISILIISIVILGGMGTIRGMFVGAALLISFPEILRFASAYRFVIYGLILVIMIRFRPQGLFGGQSSAKYVLPKGVKVGAKDGIA
ncbi:MAG: branched-chain amino acid ABC transporter permease [Peptostreptococcales bacterium]